MDINSIKNLNDLIMAYLHAMNTNDICLVDELDKWASDPHNRWTFLGPRNDYVVRKLQGTAAAMVEMQHSVKEWK